MANGQTSSVGTFDRRFIQPSTQSGQPTGTVPGESAPSLGQGNLSNAQSSADDEKNRKQKLEQMTKDAGEAFQSLVISRDNQIRSGGGPGQFFALLEKEFIEAARVWKETRKLAGKDTAVVDRSLAKALDDTPKVPITFTTIKDDERRLREQGGVSQVAVPAVRTIPQGAVESTGGVAGVQGQPPTPRAGPAPPQFVQLQQTRDLLRSAGKDDAANEIDDLLTKMKSPTGLKFRSDGKGGFELATGGANLTTTTITGAEKQKRQTTELLANVSTLKRLLEKSGKPVVGALAAFRGFLNKTAVQFVPGLFDKDRAKFERATKAVRQTSLRVVSDETRFSEADRDFVFDLFPSTGIFESEEEVSVKLNVLTAFFARRFSGALTDLGIDQASIPQITPEDIKVALESGFLDKEEAGKILRQLFPERFTRD